MTRFRILVSLLAALFLAAPLASADPLVSIVSGAVVPASLDAAEGQFSFVNDSAVTARLVFDRKSSKSVECGDTAEATGRRGQYLVTPGATLVCSGNGSSLGYTVYRSNGGGGLETTKGKIVLR